MRCPEHRKETVGPCIWCGKKLCPMCIAKKDGQKLQCDKCYVVLKGTRREKLPKPQMTITQTTSSSSSGGKPKFVLKDGYLVIEGE